MLCYKLYKGAWIFSSNPHKEVKLNKSQISELFGNGGVFVRNIYDFDCNEESSFYYVIKDSFGGMEELSSKMRNQVKKCFKTIKVEKIGPDALLKEGYDIFVKADQSYKVKANPPSKQEFESRINNGAENEYWGCFDIESGKLVAFCLNTVTDDCCEYNTMKALPEYLKQYAYYGLIYEMNRYYLDERHLKYVNDGARSLTNHSNIQPFLIEKFNFKKAYCKCDIYYKWWLSILVNLFYPFRSIIPNRKVKALLNMEAIARNKI